MSESSTEATNLQAARRYLATIEAGVTGDALAAFFTEDVVQEEFPNRLVPTGARRDLRALLEGAERGQTVLMAQRFDVRGEVASGDRVALELVWTARSPSPSAACRRAGRCARTSPCSWSSATGASPRSATTTASIRSDRRGPEFLPYAGAPLPGPPPQTAWGRENGTRFTGACGSVPESAAYGVRRFSSSSPPIRIP